MGSAAYFAGYAAPVLALQGGISPVSSFEYVSHWSAPAVPPLGQRIVVALQRVVGPRCLAPALKRAVASAFGIDTRREPTAVHPGGEIRADERRDPRLVGGEV